MDRERFVSRSIDLLAITLLTYALAYGYQLAMARTLGPVQFGTLAALLAVLAMFDAPLGALQATVTQYVAHWRGLDRSGLRALLRKVLLLTVICGAVIAIVLPLGGSILSERFHDNVPLLALAGLAFAIGAPANVFQGELQGDHRFRAWGLVALLGALARFTVAVGLILLGLGIVGALLGTLARAVVILVASVALAGMLRRTDARPLPAGDFARFGIPVMGALLSLGSITNIDLIAAKLFLDAHDAGIYAASSVAGRVALFLTAAMPMVLLPMVSEGTRQGRDMRHLLKRGLILAFALTASVTAAYGLGGDWISRTLFGEAFGGQGRLMTAFGLAMIPVAMLHVLVHYAVATRRMAFVGVVFGLTLAEGIALLIWHGSSMQILSAVAAAASVGVVAGFALLWRTPPAQPEPGGK